MLGSLTFYRRLLHEKVFSTPSLPAVSRAPNDTSDATKEAAQNKLPTVGHALAGIMAGTTVSFIAAPVEHIKARLQVQYAADKKQRLYSGPIGRRFFGAILSLYKRYYEIRVTFQEY